jgi:cell division cycle 2-like
MLQQLESGEQKSSRLIFKLASANRRSRSSEVFQPHSVQPPPLHFQLDTMSGARSRWADQPDSKAIQREKDEKKRAKAEREQVREAERAARRLQKKAAEQETKINDRPSKRRRLSDENILESVETQQKEDGADDVVPLLHLPSSSWSPSRGVDNFEQLNSIEEGSYGYVSRARDISTGEIVALKKLKLGNEAVEGFPVTALREIQALRLARHRHVVNLKEVVVGKAGAE